MTAAERNTTADARTPEDIIDEAATSYGDGNIYLDGEMALAALDAAGYDVVPRTPDTPTDSDKAALDYAARPTVECPRCFSDDKGRRNARCLPAWNEHSWHTTDSDTAARLPSKCPTCGSENPATYYGSCFDNQHSTIFDPRLPLDPWHAYMTDLRLLRRDVDNLNAYVKAGREVRERVEAERDAARAQMQSLTESFVEMEARAVTAERERDAAVAQRDALAEVLHSVWLYIDWRYVTKQLTTEQKNLFADAVDAHSEEPPVADRWWAAADRGTDR